MGILDFLSQPARLPETEEPTAFDALREALAALQERATWENVREGFSIPMSRGLPGEVIGGAGDLHYMSGGALPADDLASHLVKLTAPFNPELRAALFPTEQQAGSSEWVKAKGEDLGYLSPRTGHPAETWNEYVTPIAMLTAGVPDTADLVRWGATRGPDALARIASNAGDMRVNMGTPGAMRGGKPGRAKAGGEVNEKVAGTWVTSTGEPSGAPRVVYHGTQNVGPVIDKFDPQGGPGGINNVGTWFTSEPKYAGGYAERFTDDGLETTSGAIYPALLKMQNPWVLEGAKGFDEFRRVANYRSEGGKNLDALREYFRNSNKDGVIIRNFDGDKALGQKVGVPKQDIYLVFDDSQIVSAVGAKAGDKALDAAAETSRGTVLPGKQKGAIDLFGESPAKRDVLRDEISSQVSGGSIAAEVDPNLPAHMADRAGQMARSRSRVGTTGQFIGAPRGVDSADKYANQVEQYVDKVEKVLDDGVPPGYFYGEGSEILGRLSPTQEDSHNLARLAGITSSEAPVKANYGWSMKGLEQQNLGARLETGLYPNQQRGPLEKHFAGELPYIGDKRERYARALEFGPDYVGPSPNDRWEIRGWGFGKDTATQPQHAWMDEARRHAVNELERRRGMKLTPAGLQELHWLGEIAEATGKKPHELLDTYTLQSAIPAGRVSHSWETASPRIDSEHSEVLDVLLDPTTGRDRLVESFGGGGIYQEPAVRAPGYYKGERTPGVQSFSQGYQTSRGADDATMARATATEYTRALMLGQDAAGGHMARPLAKGQSLSHADGVEFRGAEYNEYNAPIIDQLVQSRLGGYAFPAATPDGFRLMDISPPFPEKVESVTDGLTELLGDVKLTGEGSRFTVEGAGVKGKAGNQVLAKIEQLFDAEYGPGAVKVAKVKGGDVRLTEVPFAKRVESLDMPEGTPIASDRIYEELDWAGSKATERVLEELDTPRLGRYTEEEGFTAGAVPDTPETRQLMGELSTLYERYAAEGRAVPAKLIDVMKAWKRQGLEGVQRLVDNGMAPAIFLNVFSQYDNEQT